MIHFYLGGARSGKSGLAEAWVHRRVAKTGQQVHYVATARQHPSMAERIALHRARRPATWTDHECELALTSLLAALSESDNLVMVDCLTLWLTNQMMAGADLNHARDALLVALANCRADVVLVSTEVGQSLVPDDPMSRAFVEASGELHQGIAALADQVLMCQSGVAVALKKDMNQ